MRAAFAFVGTNPYVRVATAILALFALSYFALRTQTVWISFFLAYLLAYTANPLVIWLQRHRIRRSLGVVAVILIFLLFIAFVLLLVSVMARQIQSFAQELPALMEPLLVGEQSIPVLMQQLVPAGFEDTLIRSLEGLPEQLERFGEALLAWLSSLVGGVLQLVIILVLTIYLMLSFPHIGQSILEFFPRRYRDDVQRVSQDIRDKFDQAVAGYIRAQLLVSMVVGVLIWLSLSVLGVPLAATWGIIGGVGNLIPFVGPILAAIPAFILAVLVDSLGLGFIVLLAFVFINQIDGYILTPMILSRVIALHPVTVVLAILAGVNLFGLWGALLAVPTVGFFKLIYLDYYLGGQWYQDRNELP